MNSLGSRLRESIREMGITQKELSEVTGLTQAAISRYVNGNRQPGAQNIGILADALGVSADYLLGVGATQTEVEQALGTVLNHANELSLAQRETLLRALVFSSASK